MCEVELLAALAMPRHRHSEGRKGLRIKDPKSATVSYFTERALDSDLRETWDTFEQSGAL